MTHDPLWLTCPRWIQESGIPQRLAGEIGLDGWVVFRKLIELDCDANLTPDWFAVRAEDISNWTGIRPERIDSLLDRLEDGEWIECINRDLDVQNVQIANPLPLEVDEVAIRQKLVGEGVSGGRFILRYLDNLALLEKVERVIYFYQMLFGAKFSPRIVEDLEEIANNYPQEIIYQLFQEAYQKKVKTLAWIKSRLPNTSPDS